MARMGNTTGRNFFSLVTIRITGIINTVFRRYAIFMLHTSNKILIFFEKNRSFSYISLIYFTLDISLTSWCIIYDTQFIFFQKQRRLLSKTNLVFWSFTLGSKLNFLEYFIKNKKYKKELKYFTKIKFWNEGKLNFKKRYVQRYSHTNEKLLQELIFWIKTKW